MSSGFFGVSSCMYLCIDETSDSHNDTPYFFPYISGIIMNTFAYWIYVSYSLKPSSLYKTYYYFFWQNRFVSPYCFVVVNNRNKRRQNTEIVEGQKLRGWLVCLLNLSFLNRNVFLVHQFVSFTILPQDGFH